MPPATPPASFSFADVWEMVADAIPEREALVCGAQRRTYGELEERSNRLAHHLRGVGVTAGQHVALYLENCAEYLETMLACFKIRAVPINVNHRYVASELRWIVEAGSQAGVVAAPRTLRRKTRESLAWALMILFAAAAAVLGLRRRSGCPSPLRRG